LTTRLTLVGALLGVTQVGVDPRARLGYSVALPRRWHPPTCETHATAGFVTQDRSNLVHIASTPR